MSPGNLLHMVIRGVLSRKRRTAFLVCGVGAGVSLLLILSSFCLGMKQVVLERVVKTFPATQLEVKPFRTMGEKESILITRDTIGAIKKMRGVVRVLPMTCISYPSMISSCTIGLESECAVYGIEGALVAEDIAPEKREFFRYGVKPVPVVISRDLIELYNTSLAQSQGLPFVPQELLIGQSFNLFLGVSVLTFGTVDRVRCERCMIIGASDRVPLMGVSVPWEYVKEWQKWYYEPLEAKEYIFSVVVQTDSVMAADGVAKELAAEGLRVTSGRETAEKVSAIAKIVLVFLGVVTLSLLFVVGVGIMNGLAMAVMEQSERIGLLRACGASRRDILGIFIGEAVLIGLVGGLAGLAAGGGVLWLVDHLAFRYLPAFPFKPDSFFSCPAWLLCFIMLFTLLVSIISGAPPAMRAAHLKPAEALRA